MHLRFSYVLEHIFLYNKSRRDLDIFMSYFLKLGTIGLSVT